MRRRSDSRLLLYKLVSLAHDSEEFVHLVERMSSELLLEDVRREDSLVDSLLELEERQLKEKRTGRHS